MGRKSTQHRHACSSGRPLQRQARRVRRIFDNEGTQKIKAETARHQDVRSAMAAATTSKPTLGQHRPLSVFSTCFFILMRRAICAILFVTWLRVLLETATVLQPRPSILRSKQLKAQPKTISMARQDRAARSHTKAKTKSNLQQRSVALNDKKIKSSHKTQETDHFHDHPAQTASGRHAW